MVLNILEDYLRWQAYPYERIDGCVKGNDRQAAIDRLQGQHRLATFVQAWDELLTRLLQQGGQGPKKPALKLDASRDEPPSGDRS